MRKITDIHIGEQLTEENNFFLYRGVRKKDNQAILLKVDGSPYHSPEQFSTLQREFDIIRLFSSESIIKAFAIGLYLNKQAMLLEDIGAIPLTSQSLIPETNPAIFLKFALRLTKALAVIHAKDITHNAIRPVNILINHHGDRLQITNFCSARKDTGFLAKEWAEDTLFYDNESKKPDSAFGPTALTSKELAYCSPELTGRIDRPVSKRSDLYSLGVVLYEQLTGSLPFTAEDPLQITHAHLARKPQPPHERQPEVPLIISRIILKLLEKFPDNRYRSCTELQLDLENCLRQQEENGFVREFEPGAQSSLLSNVPHVLYGRESELEQLKNGYNALKNNNSLLLVLGSSGTGKTALVQQFQKTICKDQCFFLSGKFDQYQLDSPYAPLIECLRILTRNLLSKSQHQLDNWKTKILKALAGNGRILVKVIPELELIIGKQPLLQELNPVEKETRFKQCLKNFIRACCSEEESLILFLDDMQWADKATLGLLELFITDPSLTSLMVIGAFRHDELEPNHPLSLFLSRQQLYSSNSSVIPLNNLSLLNIRQYLTDNLPCCDDFLQPLAKICQQKTNGNPFFLRQFIHTLFQRGYLYFDVDKNGWNLDHARVKAEDITDNAVSLILVHANDLSPHCQHMLQLASCLGNRFDFETMVLVYNSTNDYLFQLLEEAIQEGFLLNISHTGNLNKSKASTPSKQGQKPSELGKKIYKFAHDQIQQAIYLNIPLKKRKKLHFHIGRSLCKERNRQQSSINIFTLVSQLNQGRELIETPDERYQLAALNLKAGRKARSAIDYDLARKYFKMGLNLLGPDSWEPAHYQLTLNLHVEGAEVFYLCGDFIAMQEMVGIIEDNGLTLLDRVRIYEVEIQAFIARNKLNEAIERSQFALHLLNEDIPENPGKSYLTAQYLKTRILLMGKDQEALLNLPEMTDPYKLAAMRILYRIGTSAYYKGANFLALIACRTLQISLRYGNTSYIAATGYAAFAIIQCGTMRDISNGYANGLVAMKLQQRLVPKTGLPGCQYIFANLIQPWKKHLDQSLPLLRQAYLNALEIGETEHAALALYSHNNLLLLLGRKLPQVAVEMAESREALEQIGQEIMTYRQRLAQQLVENLLHPPEDSTRFSGRHYNEEVVPSFHKDSGDQTTLFQFYFMKLMQSFLLGQHQSALNTANKASGFLKSAISSTFLPYFYFFSSLTKIALFNESSPDKQRSFRKDIAQNQKKMRTWSNHAPMNYRHLYLLVEAERDRSIGKGRKAVDLYELAIKKAQDNGYVQIAALGYELAAGYYAAKGFEVISDSYLRQALFLYSEWGATTKTEQLIALHPQLINTFTTSSNESRPHQTAEESQLTSLDMMTMIKSSQALASEILFENVLETMLQIMIENAGAERGFLFLEEEVICAARIPGESEKGKVKIIAGKPNDALLLPLSIINLVKRSRNKIVLEDAAANTEHGNDPYIIKNKTKSVICTPVVSQGEIICILFLENNLTSGAFSPRRVELLKHLSYQAAISLRNSTLYNELKKTVQEMDREIQSHKQTQQQLLHSEKLAAMGRISASIAHEFGNPLLGLRFLLSELQSNKFLDAKQQHLLDVGVEECNRLRSMIRKLRDVYQPSSGTAERCNIESLLKNSLLFYNKLFQTNNIILRSSYLPALPEILGVKDQFTQVIINLLLNAVDAMTDKGGVLEIATGQQGNNVFFTISDNGKGIKEENQKKIFEPFFSSKSDVEGSGLGLSVSYSIISNHKGTITVESTPGKGTCFKVTLPSV